jgi:thymidylate kinase
VEPAGTNRRRLAAEVVGPPGSGKTSLLEALTASGGVGPVAEYRRIEHVPAYVWSALSLARVLLPSSVVARPSLWELNKMIRLEASASVLRRSAAASGERVVVFAQGPVYTLTRLWDLAERSSGAPAFCRWWSAKLTQWATELDLAIVLDAPDDVLMRRILDRTKRHRAKGASEASARSILWAERARYDAVLADLSRRGLAILGIDTDRSSVDEVTSIALDSLGVRAARGPGMLVAVIGSDGSGKSTLSRDLHRRLASEVDAMHLYFGSGDGPSSLLRRPMKAAKDRFLGTKESKESVADRAAGGSADRRRRPWMAAARVGWALALAAEKRRKLRAAMLARDEGTIVVCDRYPQVQFPGQNDGPLLWRWSRSGSWLLRRIASWEARPYELAARSGPDLVLRLDVDTDTAISRRPGLTRTYLDERIALVRSLRFNGSAVAEIDARRPYAVVLSEAADAVDAGASGADPRMANR